MKDYQQLRDWPNEVIHLETMEVDDRKAWPLVSLVTPSFNQAPFLEACILSVINQDYPNLEYWVYDGGSTDSSPDIIQKYSRNLAGWQSRSDAGQADAINQAWRKSRGKYVGWLNSDDMLMPDSLHTSVSYLERNPDVDLVYGDLLRVDQEGQPLEQYEYAPFDLKNMLLQQQSIPQPGTLIRRDVFQEVGVLDQELHYLMDLEYWLRLGLAGKQIGYLSKTLAIFRIHDESKTQAGSARAVEERSLVADRVLRHPNCPSEIKRSESMIHFNVSMASSRTWLKQGRFGRAIGTILQALVKHPLGLLKPGVYYTLLVSILGAFVGWERWASLRARIRQWRRSRA
jgi:GT2 family glycosyltransferase